MSRKRPVGGADRLWKREPELPMKIYAQFERAKGGLLIVFQCLLLIPQLLLVSRFVSPVLWWSPGCFRSTWATFWSGIASGGTCTAVRGISRMSGSWSAKGVSGLRRRCWFYWYPSFGFCWGALHWLRLDGCWRATDSGMRWCGFCSQSS